MTIVENFYKALDTFSGDINSRKYKFYGEQGYAGALPERERKWLDSLGMQSFSEFISKYPAIYKMNPILMLDLTDFSSLYQDSAGTIPVTGAGDPVGLVFDKSQMGGKTATQFIADQPNLNPDWSGGSVGVVGSGGALPSGWWHNTDQATIHDITLNEDGTTTVDATFIITAAGSNRFPRVSWNRVDIPSGFAYCEGYVELVSITSGNVDPASDNLFLSIVETGSGGAYIAETLTNEIGSAGVKVKLNAIRKIPVGNKARSQVAVPRLVEAGKTVEVRCKITSPRLIEIPGQHLLQETSAQRPLYQAGGSLLFDGVDDSVSAAISGISDAVTICADFTHQGGTGSFDWPIAINDNTSSLEEVGCFFPPAGDRIYLKTSTGGAEDQPSHYLGGTLQIGDRVTICGAIDGSSIASEVYLNGAFLDSFNVASSVGVSPSLSNLSVATSLNSNKVAGNYKRLVLFNRFLTKSERSLVAQWVQGG